MLNLTNQFERLVIDYSHLGACWNLGCTTCECMHIRSAFRHLDNLPNELDIRNKSKWEWDRDLRPTDDLLSLQQNATWKIYTKKSSSMICVCN